MFGWEMMLMAAGMDPKGFGEVVESYGKFIMQYFEILAESDSDVIMIHDDLCWTSGPVMAPEWYREYVFPILKKETMLLKDCNKKVLFTSDGNYTEFVDDIAKCGVDGFVLEPTTDLGYIAQKYGKTHVIVGNADTRILLSGTKEDIEAEVKRCMDIGKHCPGFFMAVGNHIPSNTPVENALYYNEMYEKYSVR
jgi:uroporphyrinogen-III decarboxylase